MNLVHMTRAVDLASSTMRSSSIVQFAKVLGATGVGTYLGATAAGIVAVVTGTALTQMWLAGIPGLAIGGAAAGAIAGPVTRGWFLPDMPRRRVVFPIGGAVTLPLVSTIAALDHMPGLLTGAVFLGGGTTLVVYLRAARTRTR